MSLFPGVALVTGAASGIGRATAVAFAAEGCTKIAICDRAADGLAETKRLIEGKQGDDGRKVEVEVVAGDVSREESVTNMVQTIVKRWGRIDYAVNCAGIQGPPKRSTEFELEEFDAINRVNYRGLWMCSRAELKQMMKQEPLQTHDGRPGNRGVIVHIASQLGIVSRTNAAAYCASKAAVISLTKSDAIDYSNDRIQVNCVCPGLVQTPMVQGPEQQKLFAPAVAIAPMDRMGEPEEIADACLFLCSSKATFVQGAALVVDGGYTIN
ncbi:hypothetical protein BJY01DRAFT_230554 [Aspergillus pseudoustus]|uniref:NAD(P)-binding protein n=1 Tax=Aspergillus pseudoustus TaxID=1810923 RepID=A0ABR4I8U6_9EURO